jgi:hypothetical protein
VVIREEKSVVCALQGIMGFSCARQWTLLGPLEMGQDWNGMERMKVKGPLLFEICSVLNKRGG